MEFTVQLLGTNSALPLHNRYPTSQFLQVAGKCFLIDCGEGAQIQMSRFKVKRNKISHIFISHLHGDHLYGLPGLLGSFNHFNRTAPLSVYGPQGLEKYLTVIQEVSQAYYSYPLNVEELEVEKPGVLNISPLIKVEHFPLRHRIPTIGYNILHTPHERNIIKVKIQEYGLSVQEIMIAKKGNDIQRKDGTIITCDEVCYPMPAAKKYSYCSDTVYDKDIIPYINGADLLYHETTYLDDMEKEAAQRMHTTLGQAINIAKKAKAGKLLTGHYSSRYDNLEVFIKAAKKSSFPVEIGEDGKIYKI